MINEEMTTKENIETLNTLDNPNGYILSTDERQDIIDEMLTYLDDTDGRIETAGVTKAKEIVDNTGTTQIDGTSQQILKDFNFQPQEVVFIGDAIDDYQGAKEAGVRFIWRTKENNPFFELEKYV